MLKSKAEVICFVLRCSSGKRENFPEYYNIIILLLPMFTEKAHSLAMIAHSMRVVRAAVAHGNLKLQLLLWTRRCLSWPRKFSGDLVVFMTKIGLFLCLAGLTRKWRPRKCSAGGSLGLDG